MSLTARQYFSRCPPPAATERGCDRSPVAAGESVSDGAHRRVSLAEAVLLLAVGVLVFGLRLPTDLFGWFTFAWVFVLSGTYVPLAALPT